MTQSLIGTAIIGIVISAFSITMGSFQQSSRALAQKMEITQLQTNIKGRLSAGNLCFCNLQSSVGTGTAQVMVPKAGSLKMRALFGRCVGSQASSPILEIDREIPDSLTNLSVESIMVEDFNDTGANNYSANLVVRFKPEGLVVGRRPLSVPLQIQTLSVGGGAIRIASCSTADDTLPHAGGGIPGTLAGDPGSICQYGETRGPTGVTMYSIPDPAEGLSNPTPVRRCCIVASPGEMQADRNGVLIASGSVLQCL